MPDSLQLEKISDSLSSNFIKSPEDVELFQNINSTSEWVMLQCKQGRKPPFACFAEQQTSGKGRRGGEWVSPPNANIYMSFSWSFDLSMDEITVLPLAIGVAIIKTLQQSGINQAKLKWPNDVMVAGRKIAGVLIETAQSSSKNSLVVVGVGLNYQMPSSVAEINNFSYTDVVHEADDNSLMSRNQLSAVLLDECLSACTAYVENRPRLITEFQLSLDEYKQKNIRVIFGDGKVVNGIANGITENGELRVLVDGREEIFCSADVSLRQAS